MMADKRVVGKLGPDFAAKWLRTIQDLDDYPVHLLFNMFWSGAPEDVKARYVADYHTVPENKLFWASRHYADPIELVTLAAMPEGSLGRGYWRFLTDNKLEKNLATNYRIFHDALEQSGVLKGMPEEIKYATLRGFQLHDLMHVISGYDATPLGEIALQAFCLAQQRSLYFSTWIATVTARMAFIDPDSQIPLMDAISDGWASGRRAKNIMMREWERDFGRSLADIRREFAITPPSWSKMAA
jgi:ubiquinone biosynthesis protein COQ4